ncbi:MAG: sugar ABC transporter substrate-binding protein, partial [Treponema sp.]|nr:sugar ABC transporter substrate-binding protein [Treponema sp.]
MKKLVTVVAAVLCAASLFVSCARKGDSAKSSGEIKIGIINNPPSESGYRAANVKDMETVFSAAKGYKVST